MDSGYVLKLENPRKSANIFSTATFGWMIKFCYKGVRQHLKLIDVYKTLERDSSEKLSNQLYENWEKELTRAKVKNSPPSLLRAIAKTFFWSYMFYGIVILLLYMLIRWDSEAISLGTLIMVYLRGSVPTPDPFNVKVRSSQPVVLSYFIQLFSNSDNDYVNMYILGTVIVLESLILVFCVHHTDFGQSLIGMRARVAVSSLVYRKVLKLSKSSLSRTPGGQILNLLSNDVSRFDMICLFLHYLWIVPFFVVLLGYLIWREVGISALAGILSMLCFTLPIQGYLGKMASRIRLAVAERTDSRIKLMSEVVSSMQVIKMYAWEKPFEALVKLSRKLEIDEITKACYLRGVYSSCMVFIERTTLFLTIITFVLLGNRITADKVFSMAQFYNILQAALAIQYPMAILFGAETLVSIKRLETFLMLEEKGESFVKSMKSDEWAVIAKNVQASWDVSSTGITLDSFNLSIPRGTLCAIIGSVGAGKSSILQLLLGELPIRCGSVEVAGTMSYSSQEPWLFAATVRNNILFGQSYEKLRYKSVVRVCGLERDLEQFPRGDQTLVGEKGVSLSGGQKARINLARAIYRDADVYLMDDPLSAVDTHIGKHLFEECIVKYLRGRTRILVTHQLQHLQKADLIVVVNEGKIEAKGTFQELSVKALDFGKLLSAASEHTTPTQDLKLRKASIISNTSLLSVVSHIEDPDARNDEELEAAGAPFKDYLNSAGNCLTIFGLITALISGQVACSAADYWITFWTQQEEIGPSNFTDDISYNVVSLFDPFDSNSSSTDVENTHYKSYYVHDTWSSRESSPPATDRMIETDLAIYVYTGLIVAAIFLTLFRSFFFYKLAMTASKNLHSKMFHALLKAPMKFFNTNPSGRILNRFSKDMGTVDEILPTVILDSIQIFLVMSGILIMVTIANYYMVIVIAIMAAIFLKIRSWYIATARDVKYLEGTAKSPVFSHLNSSLNGITTIRAYKVEKMLEKQFDQHQDVHTSTWFLTLACRECFGLWLDFMAVVFVSIVTYSFVILNQYNQVSGSLVGLAISQALILTTMLQYGIRQTSEAVNQLTSVDRVMQYTKLENENTQMDNSGKTPPTFEPTKGTIEFKEVCLRYSEYGPFVLKNLNFFIPSGGRIGVVGRTGAGKTSLISALFRIAPFEGSIFIDDIDISKVPLHILRTSISIIPQEPVLFTASLRYNLDPFNEFDDSLLWDVLKEVELKDVPSLEYKVVESGANFSLGQRQLICLARAILRNKKILVLDEATANVDSRTDALIQSTIRRKFSGCTILTIAHRLKTIMDSDKVLVMNFGEVVEFDHPHVLMQNTKGYFHKMVLEGGPSLARELQEIAEKYSIENNLPE